MTNHTMGLITNHYKDPVFKQPVFHHNWMVLSNMSYFHSRKLGKMNPIWRILLRWNWNHQPDCWGRVITNDFPSMGGRKHALVLWRRVVLLLFVRWFGSSVQRRPAKGQHVWSFNVQPAMYIMGPLVTRTSLKGLTHLTDEEARSLYIQSLCVCVLCWTIDFKGHYGHVATYQSSCHLHAFWHWNR